MEQETNNLFEYVDNKEMNLMQDVPIQEINQTDDDKITEDFVTGLPSWDLEPPYEVIRRVTR